MPVVRGARGPGAALAGVSPEGTARGRDAPMGPGFGHRQPLARGRTEGTPRAGLGRGRHPVRCRASPLDRGRGLARPAGRPAVSPAPRSLVEPARRHGPRLGDPIGAGDPRNAAMPLRGADLARGLVPASPGRPSSRRRTAPDPPRPADRRRIQDLGAGLDGIVAVQGRHPPPVDPARCGAAGGALPPPPALAAAAARTRPGSCAPVRHGSEPRFLGRLAHQVRGVAPIGWLRSVDARTRRAAVGVRAMFARPPAPTGRHADGRGRWRPRPREPRAPGLVARATAGLLPIGRPLAPGGPPAPRGR